MKELMGEMDGGFSNQLADHADTAWTCNSCRIVDFLLVTIKKDVINRIKLRFFRCCETVFLIKTEGLQTLQIIG